MKQMYLEFTTLIFKKGCCNYFVTIYSENVDIEQSLPVWQWAGITNMHSYLQYIHHTIENNNTTHLLLSEVVSIIYKKMMVLDSNATDQH